MGMFESGNSSNLIATASRPRSFFDVGSFGPTVEKKEVRDISQQLIPQTQQGAASDISYWYLLRSVPQIQTDHCSEPLH